MRIVVFGVLASIACTGATDTTPNVSGGPAASPLVDGDLSRAAVERDLALEMTRTTTEGVDHERHPSIEVWVVNRSATVSYPIVLANDGSEVGWREPHAFFTVERQVAGAWEPMPEAQTRCRRSCARCRSMRSDPCRSRFPSSIPMG